MDLGEELSTHLPGGVQRKIGIMNRDLLRRVLFPEQPSAPIMTRNKAWKWVVGTVCTDALMILKFVTGRSLLALAVLAAKLPATYLAIRAYRRIVLEDAARKRAENLDW